jgi:hypothetical protein
MQKKDNTSPPPLEPRAEGNIPVADDSAVLIWSASSFAHEWFNDALKEAREGRDRSSRRREIVFAVCFTESYLFEWARDEIPGLRIDKLSQYFPQGDRRGIRARWKDVLKNLYKDKRIKEVPSFDPRINPHWNLFVDLVDYRDGLVHASASRPEIDIDSQSTTPAPPPSPIPSPTDLDQLPAGWAVRVVVTVVRQLHQAVGTNPPAWLCEP